MSAVPGTDSGGKKADNDKSRGKNHYTTVHMVPCKVCGKKSSGYHFGVVTCEACKAFFRRTLLRKSSISRKCRRGDSKCGTDPASITGCPVCRLARCLEQGMSKEGARKGRYSMELRTISIIEAKSAENEQQKCSSRDSPRLDALDIVPTSQLQDSPGKSSDFDGLRTDQNDTKCGRRETRSRRTRSVIVCNKNGSRLTNKMQPDMETSNETNLQSAITDQNSDNCCTDDPVALDYSLKKTQSSIEEHDSIHPPSLPDPFTRDVEEFDHVISELVQLQEKLYPHPVCTENIELRQRQIEEEHKQREETYHFMFGSSEYVTAKEFKEVLSEMNIEIDDRLAILREKAKESEKNIVLYVQHSKAIPGFDTLDLNDVLKLLKESYYEFWLFSNHIFINGKTGISGGADSVINAHKKVVSLLFPETFVDAIFSFADTLRNLKLTLKEVAIIRVIILTFTDRCNLKYPERVQKLHDMFTHCLLYHLSKTRENYRQRLCQIMERLVEVRTLTHMNRSVNQQFLKDWSFFMKDFPLWREMMSVAPKYE